MSDIDERGWDFENVGSVSRQARTLRFGLIFKFGRMELESAQAGLGHILNDRRESMWLWPTDISKIKIVEYD